MSLTTKSIATVSIGVALILAGSFAFATPVKADILSDLQAQVQALLAQIAALQGGSPVVGGSCVTFSQNHQMGDTGGQVMSIQKFLNSHGAQIAASGAGSPGNETSYFGSLTRAAISKYQVANGISPTAGYWGPVTRAKANSQCTGTPGVPGMPISGNGLKVMLASDSPSNSTLVQGQGIGELAKFVFANPTGAEITVTSVGFTRIGASVDSSLAAVYLYNGATRLTDTVGITNAAFTFNDTAGIFKVPAGGSVTISVRGNISATAGGEQMGVRLTTVGASGTLDSSVVLPINGSILLISTASMGTVAFTYNGPTGGSENPGTDIRVFQANAAVSTHKAWLQSVTFENRGTADSADFKNVRLYVDGTMVGSAVANVTADKVTFDLSAGPLSLSTQTHEFKVIADVIGGSGKTFDFQIRRAADVRLVDAELNQPILSTDTDTSFPVSAASANSIGAASLSIVKAAGSPTSNVAVDATNVLWAKFEARAAGDNVKVEQITVDTETSNTSGLDNGKVFLNGVQVGSTNDIAEAGTTFTFGSSFIARQGQTEIVEIYADAKEADGDSMQDADTVDVGVSVAAADTEGLDSGDSVTAISEVEGNSITISTTATTASKFSGYGDQTLVAGTNNARVGAVTFSAGSTEGVNVNTITVTLTAAEAASISDLRLVRNDTGAQVGSTKVSPGTSNAFSTTLAIPSSGTVTIDVIANLRTANGASLSFQADVSGSGTGATTGGTVTISSVALQTITIAGSGTLTVTRDAGTPVNTNVIAGSTSVHVGKFDFAASSGAFTVQELKIKVLADSATSVANVTLKYKNSAGAEQTVSSALALPTGALTHATATFTGLTFYVPNNDSADLDVYIDVPTTVSGAKSGAPVAVHIDATEGFKAVDSGGTPDTTSASADVSSDASSGYGTKYVKKSIPTLTRLTTGYTANTVASGIDLYRFTVTADAAGAVEWRKISFNVATDGATGATIASSWQMFDVTGGSAVTINAATSTETAPSTGQTYTLSICPNSSAATCIVGEAEQIGAGSSKTYALRASIAGWGTAGDTLAISFAEDSSAVTNGTALAGQNADYNMIWSDRSATSHATTTSDWTNGYLVKDMDSDTRSCQFGTATTCTP